MLLSVKEGEQPIGLWGIKHISDRVLTHFQTMAFSVALYFARPLEHITWTPLVLFGVGIRTSTFWAKRLALKLALTTTLISSLCLPISRTNGMRRKGSVISYWGEGIKNR